MYKKLFSILSCCFMFINLFGCSAMSSSTNNASTNDKITIRFSWWGGEDRHDKTVDAIQEFEKAYPNISVKLEFAEWTGFKKKMNMRIAGNDEPDLMQINYDWLESYSKNGDGFYDLNQVSDYLDLDNFSQDILNYGTKNRILNAIPISMNSKVMYYNKTLLDKYGLENFETWDDLLASKSKVTDNTYVLTLDEVNSWIFAMTYIKDKTGKDFLTDNNTLGYTESDIKDLLTFYKTLLDNRILKPLNTISSYDLSTADCIGLSTWSSDASKIDKSITKAGGETFVSILPAVDKANAITYVKPSMLYAISKNTEHPKEAAQLMNYLLNNTDAAEILGLDRGIPCSKTAYDTLNNSNQLSGVQFDAISKTNSIQNILINPYLENTSIKNIYNEAITSITFGTSSVDDIAHKTYTELNEALTNLN